MQFPSLKLFLQITPSRSSVALVYSHCSLCIAHVVLFAHYILAQCAISIVCTHNLVCNMFAIFLQYFCNICAVSVVVQHQIKAVYNIYVVHTLFSVQYSVYNKLRKIFCVLYFVYNIQCVIFCIHYSVCNIQCAKSGVQYLAIFGVKYQMYNICCIIFSVQYLAYNIGFAISWRSEVSCKTQLAVPPLTLVHCATPS